MNDQGLGEFKEGRTQERKSMVDEHQVNTIIATAICECSNGPSERKTDPEQAKQMAKFIIEALTDAGFEIRQRASSL